MKPLNWIEESWCTKCGNIGHLTNIAIYGNNSYNRKRAIRLAVCTDCANEISNDPDKYGKIFNIFDCNCCAGKEIPIEYMEFNYD